MHEIYKHLQYTELQKWTYTYVYVSAIPHLHLVLLFVYLMFKKMQNVAN